MIKEFGNCTDDSSDGGFGRYEGVGPSNVPSRDTRDDDSDDNDNSVDGDGDDEEDPEEESDGDKTQEKGVIHEG